MLEPEELLEEVEELLEEVEELLEELAVLELLDAIELAEELAVEVEVALAELEVEVALAELEIAPELLELEVALEVELLDVEDTDVADELESDPDELVAEAVELEAEDVELEIDALEVELLLADVLAAVAGAWHRPSEPQVAGRAQVTCGEGPEQVGWVWSSARHPVSVPSRRLGSRGCVIERSKEGMGDLRASALGRRRSVIRAPEEQDAATGAGGDHAHGQGDR